MEHKISKGYRLIWFCIDDHAVKKEFTPTKVYDESQCISSLE